jgi:hypothetical protein
MPEERPHASLCEHRDGIDVELTVPWPTDSSPVASVLLHPHEARALVLELLAAARAVRDRRALLAAAPTPAE